MACKASDSLALSHRIAFSVLQECTDVIVIPAYCTSDLEHGLILVMIYPNKMLHKCVQT